MAPKVQNETPYKDQIKNDLQKQKQNEIQKAKVDLNKINLKVLATQIGVLSEDVKLFMKLVKSNRYYALNNRTIALLMKGTIDASTIVGTETIDVMESDAEVQVLMLLETEVEIFVVDKNKTRAGGAFFNCLTNTLFDFDKYGIF